MIGGQDQEVYQAIGQLLKPILPAGAQRITAEGKVGEDWSEVSFQYVDAGGAPRHFAFSQHPARVAGDIGEQMILLRRIMSARGGDAWDRCSVTLGRDGRLTSQFGYAAPPNAN